MSESNKSVNYSFGLAIDCFIGNVTVVGGADAAPSFLTKVVESVSKVNTLKDNIPGAGGLLGLLSSFDNKHQEKTDTGSTPETK